jgi:hypothetical protein
MTTDPTHESLWRPLRDLLDLMDDDIARLYAERGVNGVRPRFSKALIKLAHLGPLSIKQLAQAVEVTHSAMSQTDGGGGRRARGGGPLPAHGRRPGPSGSARAALVPRPDHRAHVGR